MTMDIIQIAKKADMQVPFDGQIGRETCQRVCDSPWPLQCFADAIRAASAAQSAAQREAEEHIE
jgi:hypothetical protein